MSEDPRSRSATGSTPSSSTARSTRSRPTPSSAPSSSGPGTTGSTAPTTASTIRSFYRAGPEDESRAKAFVIDAGEPAILLGTDTGANPAEYLLHALAACLTTSIVYVAAARGVRLTEVESTLEGDMDVARARPLRRRAATASRHPRHPPRPRATRRPRSWRGRRPRPAALGGLRHGRHGVPVDVEVVIGGVRIPHLRPHREDRAGRRLVDSPRRSPPTSRAAPADHDRDATSRTQHRPRSTRGYFTAPIPIEHGGLGVLSVHDLVVASSRLARGDASVAIGVNMHLAVC